MYSAFERNGEARGTKDEPDEENCSIDRHCEALSMETEGKEEAIDMGAAVRQRWEREGGKLTWRIADLGLSSGETGRGGRSKLAAAAYLRILL